MNKVKMRYKKSFSFGHLVIYPKSHVYKTVKIVKDNGEGTEIEFGYHVKQFKCKNGCEHHNHAVCVLCGSYIYIDDGELEDFQDKIAQDHGFKPQKHNFKIFGVCQKCQ